MPLMQILTFLACFLFRVFDARSSSRVPKIFILEAATYLSARNLSVEEQKLLFTYLILILKIAFLNLNLANVTTFAV